MKRLFPFRRPAALLLAGTIGLGTWLSGGYPLAAVSEDAAENDRQSAGPTGENESETIRFDFGAPSRRAQGHWNHLDTPAETGIALRNAVTTAGESTAVRVRQIDDWSGYNVDGYEGDSPYPARAMGDSYYIGDDGNRQARLRIEGLEPGQRYDFELFASRMGGTDLRSALYRLGDRQATLDAHDNRDRKASFSGVAADERGTVTIDVECAKGHDYGYLGVLEVRGRFRHTTIDLEPPDPLDGPPIVSAKAWAIGEGETGELLWAHNGDVSRHMASTTKMMTCWIVLELAREKEAVLDETVTISERADGTGGSTAGVRAGERIAVRDLLYGLMLPSGNDAAAALAEHFGGRFDPPRNAESKAGDAAAEDGDETEREAGNIDALARFVAEMNRRADKLGMDETHYLDPHGMSGNRSSPRDLLALGWTAMQNPLFREYVGTLRHDCTLRTPEGGERKIAWKNTNQLLGIAGFDGVKTGTTGSAGECLVSSGRRGDDHLMVVVLGSAQGGGRYIDTRNLFRWAWIQRGHLDRKRTGSHAENRP